MHQNYVKSSAHELESDHLIGDGQLAAVSKRAMGKKDNLVVWKRELQISVSKTVFTSVLVIRIKQLSNLDYNAFVAR